jgi:hypothetical protein
LTDEYVFDVYKILGGISERKDHAEIGCDDVGWIRLALGRDLWRENCNELSGS